MAAQAECVRRWHFYLSVLYSFWAVSLHLHQCKLWSLVWCFHLVSTFQRSILSSLTYHEFGGLLPLLPPPHAQDANQIHRARKSYSNFLPTLHRERNFLTQFYACRLRKDRKRAECDLMSLAGCLLPSGEGFHPLQLASAVLMHANTEKDVWQLDFCHKQKPWMTVNVWLWIQCKLKSIWLMDAFSFGIPADLKEVQVYCTFTASWQNLHLNH